MALPKSAKKFSKTLSGFMQRESLTGPKAAERLDVLHQAIYRWLGGKNLPPRRQAERLAERMKMPDLPAAIDRERQRNRRAAARGAK
jgi:hypothetical protein